MAAPDPDAEGAYRELIARFASAEQAVAAIVQGVALAAPLARDIRVQRAKAARSLFAQVRAELDDVTRQYVRRHLSAVYLAGMVDAAGAATDLPVEWTLLHKRAMTVLAQDTFADVAAGTRYMEQQAREAIRKAAKAEVLRQVTSGKGDLGQQLAERLAREAVTGFRDAAGRRWRLRTYADMVVRTKRQAAYNTGAVLRYEAEGGVPALRIIDGTRHDDRCKAVNGDTCSKVWALANPLEHPNCTRTFAPLTRIPDDLDHGRADDRVPLVASDTKPNESILYAEPPTQLRRRTPEGVPDVPVQARAKRITEYATDTGAPMPQHVVDAGEEGLAWMAARYPKAPLARKVLLTDRKPDGTRMPDTTTAWVFPTAERHGGLGGQAKVMHVHPRASAPEALAESVRRNKAHAIQRNKPYNAHGGQLSGTVVHEQAHLMHGQLLMDEFPDSEGMMLQALVKFGAPEGDGPAARLTRLHNELVPGPVWERRRWQAPPEAPSGYATDSPWEWVAEAIVDVWANGKYAKPTSKAVDAIFREAYS